MANSNHVTTIAPSIEEFLSCHAISYDILSHVPTQSLDQAASRLKISPCEFARAVVLQDDGASCMAVLPLSYILDFSALHEITHHKFKPASVQTLGRLFPDCEPGAIPPLGMAYGLETIVDNSLYQAEHIVFEAGRHNSLVRITRDGFFALTRLARHANIAQPESSLKQVFVKGKEGVLRRQERGTSVQDFAPDKKTSELFKDLYELPVFPENAEKIIVLRNNPKASVNDLVEIVEQDPVLAAHILQYAQSSFFGYQGRVNTTPEAIAKVLGFDMAMSLALGLYILKPFRNSPDGPLGLHALWTHSSFSAALAKRLAGLVSGKHNLKPDIVYLASLVHNFGLLLFGHLFRSEFFLLNRMVSVNSEIPVVELEAKMLAMGQAREILHVGHATAGACLMQHWNLPEEVIVATREHHNVSYKGPYEAYAKLILVIDRLLKRHHIGDACSSLLPVHVMDFLGLNEEQVVSVLDGLIEDCRDSDSVIQRCVA